MNPTRTRITLVSSLLALAALTACGGGGGGEAADDSWPGESGTSTPAAADTSSTDVDPGLPGYERTSGVAGSLSSVGSDTLNNLMTLWSEGFRAQYPNVRVQVEGKGSSTAPPALIQGTAQLGPMSRAMKATELDEFERTFGYPPTQIRVAIDALAVYVNKDNPIESLSLPQLDAMFSSTRKCGFDREITTWGEAGLTGDQSGRPLSLYGRNSASGTYGYFKKVALCGGDYRETVKEQPGSASVVQGVSEDAAGIGYSGIGYRTSGVRVVPLAAEEGGTPYGVEPEDVLSGHYPLSRFLYLYVNKAPNQPLDPLIREFVTYVLASDGQRTVVKDGYLPLSADIAAEERAKLD